ncbi:hypothetical protein TcBrA4_0059940 [Trypanosoma cruzi]|nr:hypothetical protein TcBrA4_0059940 [Trypanosoma cruzi]
METSPANLRPAAVGLDERLQHTIENNRKRIINSTEKSCVAIITDASLRGWGAVYIPDFGDFEISGGKWERKSFLIMKAEARAVRLALSAFPAILPSTMDVWVDNTSLQGAANKGSSKSNAMTRGSCNGYVCFWTLAEYRHPLPTYGLQKTPPTVCHAVVCLHFRTWRKEWSLRMGAAGSCGWRSPNSVTL